MYDQTIALNQLIGRSYVMCWAAKWMGQKELIWERSYGRHGKNRMSMLRKIHALLSDADMVVHFNGRKFDIPVLNKEFLLHGMCRPRPYKQLDLYTVVRQQFRFTSNKLDSVCQELGLGRKVKHHGHELWLDCMDDKPSAWSLMKKYNCNDVRIEERLYLRLFPWMKQ